MLSEMVTSAPVERHRRKSLGAFYSPRHLVEPMVAWAIIRPDQTVLDPPCGDGIFLETAVRRLHDLGTGLERLRVPKAELEAWLAEKRISRGGAVNPIDHET